MQAAERPEGPFDVKPLLSGFALHNSKAAKPHLQALAGFRDEALIRHAARCLNSFEGPPFGTYWEAVDETTGEILDSGITRGPAEQLPKLTEPGRQYRLKELYALAAE